MNTDPGVYFWVLVIILVEINAEGVSLEMYKKGFYIWPKAQSGTTAQYWKILDTFNERISLRCNLRTYSGQNLHRDM